MGVYIIPIVYSIYNAYDIETYVDQKNNFIPYCICYKIKKNFYSLYFNEKDENIIYKSIKNIFQEKIKKNLVYIHNLDFDGALIISYITLTDDIFSYTIFAKKNSLYRFEITEIESSNTILFLCSYKIFPLSLKKIAKDFTKYEKMLFPYLFANRTNLFYVGSVPKACYWNNAEDYLTFCKLYKNIELFDFRLYSIQYCMNDVKITSDFLFKIQEILSIFNIKIDSVYSGPSLALKIFIKKFNKNRISFSNSNLHDRFIKPAYYGGRCEVYGNPIQSDFIFHYDFTGMYAQCMTEKFSFGRYTFKIQANEIKEPGFYWIVFDSNMEYPVLPIHDKINNKLMFINGINLDGCYWFEEIIYFIEMGGIVKKILYYMWFEKYDYVFEEYANFFSSMREKNSAYSLFGKNMNNFLYGRLGINEPEEHSFFIKKNELNHYINWKSWEILDIKEINNIIMLTIKTNKEVLNFFNIKKKKFKKNVALAAAITSKARIKLHKAQQTVLKHDGRVLYSDTDSIFASFRKNVLNEKHDNIFWNGAKKDTVIKDAVFVCAKTYAILYSDNKEKIKIKGFESKEVNFMEIKEKFYENKKITKKVITFKKNNFNINLCEVDKILNLDHYDKRIFSENKKYSKPIFIKSHSM